MGISPDSIGVGSKSSSLRLVFFKVTTPNPKLEWTFREEKFPNRGGRDMLFHTLLFLAFARPFQRD
jgi:hypothetical protein